VKLPAKTTPAAIARLVEIYRRDRQTGETLERFIARAGKSKLKEELIPFTIVPSFEDDPSFYYDWEGESEFVMEDLGPGECAGGALEMIDNRILEAEQELYQARVLAEKHQHGMAVNKAYRAVLAAAKAVLVTEGLDPATDAETLTEFDRLFGNHTAIPVAYRHLGSQVTDLGPKDASDADVKERISFARGFVEACKTATEDMAKDLKLKGGEADGQSQVPAPEKAPAAAETSAVVLDLRGVMCPLNYVKTKLKLEMMDTGERLEVWLDAGDPIKNVPMSLKNDGHKILAEEPLEAEAAHFKLLVEKVEA
jgi:sulfite reductase (ferredoxin)